MSKWGTFIIGKVYDVHSSYNQAIGQYDAWLITEDETLVNYRGEGSTRLQAVADLKVKLHKDGRRVMRDL